MDFAKLKVELIDYTPNPDRLVTASARLCYSPKNGEDLFNNMTDEEINKLVKQLVSSGHESPLEHCTFTFAISGVSRVVTHELVRHRIASYSQRSQRYITEDNCNFILPKSIKDNEVACMYYKKALKNVQDAYKDLLSCGIAKEDARYILPNATETKIMVTMNARSLLNFFKLRTCHRAQPEMQEMANEMLRAVKKVAPVIFSNAGPSCVCKGKCDQGKLSCGNPVSLGTITDEEEKKIIKKWQNEDRYKLKLNGGI